MTHVVSRDAVRGLALFAGLSEQDKGALIQEGRMRRCSRGEMLFAHGEPVTQFYVVVEGNIQLFRVNADGREKTIDVLKAGQTMCEGEILDSCRAHRVNAMSVGDSVVLQFPLFWLKSSARKHHLFALNLLSLISEQAHNPEVEAEHQASMSAAQLVACFLQRLCVLYDFDPKGFELPYSKTLIASRLGMELETFSRTLARLREHGISVEGTRVEITDLRRVQQYVCGFCSVAEDCATHQKIGQRALLQ